MPQADFQSEFTSLYQDSLKLTSSIEYSNIPYLEKGIPQLEEITQYTAKSLVKSTSNHDKASFLLASKGIDAEKLSQELTDFYKETAKKAENAPETMTVQQFLISQREEIVSHAMQQMKHRTEECMLNAMQRLMSEDYEDMKRSVFDLLNTKASAMQKSVDNSTKKNKLTLLLDQEKKKNKIPRYYPSTSALERSQEMPLKMSHSHVESSITLEMKLYYQVVKEYMAQRSPHSKSLFNLIQAFERAALESIRQGPKHEIVYKSWQMLSSMLTTKTDSSLQSRKNVYMQMEHPIENEFADAIKDESSFALIRNRFAFGSRLFLENQYYKYVQQVVLKHQLPIGGVPDVISSVRAFVRHMIESSTSMIGTLDERNLRRYQYYAIVYYTLRCGGEKEAFMFIQSALKSGDDTFDPDILTAVEYLMDQKRSCFNINATPLLPFSKQYPSEYERLVERYHRMTSSSMDSDLLSNPFERSVLNILCLMNPNMRESGISTTIEDYLWQRLCFIDRLHVSPMKGAPDSVYSISKLAQSIKKFGPSHFENSSEDNTNAPLIYFQILLVIQDFEGAVKYIASKGFLLEAVHFAIALNYYGILNCAIVSLGEEENETNLDMTRLIRQYVHIFQRTNPCEAAEYYMCIPDTVARQHLLVDLLLECKKLDVLIGSINNADGCRSRGLFDRLLQDENEVRQVISAAAKKADRCGQYHDALQLFQIAGDIENVILLLCTQLSSALSSSRQERVDYFRLGKEFADQWLQHPWVQNIATRNARSSTIAFQTLLKLCIFLNLLDNEQHSDAIRFIEELEIIPTVKKSNSSITFCVDRFLAFEESVRQNFHLILIGYMECLVHETERLKLQLGAQMHHKNIASLKEKAELLVTFAGMLKYRLPSGTNERLSRMEAMIL